LTAWDGAVQNANPPRIVAKGQTIHDSSRQSVTKKRNKKVRIHGAGIAGLTAAINLAQRGYEVLVVEKRSKIGSKFRSDFQGLENWTTSTDILTYLNTIHVGTDFEHEPFRECFWYDRNLKKYTIRSNTVGFYLVKRGVTDDSLDSYLARTARKVGVTVRCGSAENPDRADIIATGAGKPFLAAAGINFESDIEKLALAIFDDSIAPLGYAYLLGLGGRGTLAVFSKAGTGSLLGYLERAIERFGKILTFQISNPTKFAGCGTRFRGIGRGIPLIGEAGGFQDAMWGFGIRMAFQTGFLAARAVSEDLDYWSLVEEEVAPLCRSSTVNRLLYDVLRSRRYRYILSKTSQADDPVLYANRLYGSTGLKRLLFPVANSILGGGKG
jgi:flavin-dependent dehydrogenase